MTQDLLDRVVANIDFGDCWEWTGGGRGEGYGALYDGEKYRNAHRLVYELVVEPIPDGLELDHLCRNRACVNPDHLEPVTHRENMLRGEGASGKNARKTHCPQGHEYNDANTYYPTRGGRECRPCRNVAAAAAHKRARERSR